MAGKLVDKLWLKSKLCTGELELRVKVVREKTVTTFLTVDRMRMRVVFSFKLGGAATTK